MDIVIRALQINTSILAFVWGKFSYFIKRRIGKGNSAFVFPVSENRILFFTMQITMEFFFSKGPGLAATDNTSAFRSCPSADVATLVTLIIRRGMFLLISCLYSCLIITQGLPSIFPLKLIYSQIALLYKYTELTFSIDIVVDTRLASIMSFASENKKFIELNC